MVTLGLIDHDYERLEQLQKENYLANLIQYDHFPSQAITNKINQLGPLPQNTLYMGMCDDGLPLLIDLTDPTPRNLIVMGHQRTGKSALLKTLLLSTNIISKGQTPTFSVITPNVGEYNEYLSFHNCLAILSSFEREAAEHIIDISILAEQRRSGRNRGPAHVLILEDINNLLEINDFDTLNHLQWLISRGSLSSCWTFASLDLINLSDQYMEMLSKFLTHIYCNRDHKRLSSGADHTFGKQIPGYSLQLGSKTRWFWLPD